MQAFNWESHHQNWFQRVTEQANRFASLGFTVVWLPPFTESVSPQGYMPLDLYNLNSRYGSEEDLRRCTSAQTPLGDLAGLFGSGLHTAGHIRPHLAPQLHYRHTQACLNARPHAEPAQTARGLQHLLKGFASLTTHELAFTQERSQLML